MRFFPTVKIAGDPAVSAKLEHELNIKFVKERLIEIGIGLDRILSVAPSCNPYTPDDGKFFIRVDGLNKVLTAEVGFRYLTAQRVVERLYYVGSEYLDPHYFEVPVSTLADLDPILN